MPLYRAYNIEYDTNDATNLPKEMDVYVDNDQDINYDGAGVITEKTGVPVLEFKYRLI